MSNIDEIRKLKDLLDEGAITPEEFDSEKQKVLGMNVPNTDVTIPLSSTNPPAASAYSKPKKKGKGCLIFSIVLCVFLVAIAVGILGNPTSNSSVNGNVVTSAGWTEFDAQTWENFKNLYKAHNQMMQAIDLYSNGNMSKLDFYNFLKEVESYFASVSVATENGNNEEQKTYANVLVSMALADQSATQNLTKYLDNNSIEDLSKAQEQIERAKEAATLFASNRGLLLVKAGLTDEEIAKKIEVDMAELESLIKSE